VVSDAFATKTSSERRRGVERRVFADAYRAQRAAEKSTACARTYRSPFSITTQAFPGPEAALIPWQHRPADPLFRRGAFVDFSDVWLAYNSELLAANQGGGHQNSRCKKLSPSSGRPGCGKSTFHEADDRAEEMLPRGRINIDGTVTGPVKVS
jgi:hypothetical protein